ncbi:MAG: AbrB/MazE/SpoVT family DNA-binding domain-containing protein [Cetobacterium sp.]
MKKRELKISFTKSGSGSDSSRITLPITWIKQMGLNIDKRDVEVNFNGATRFVMKSYDMLKVA